MFLLTNSCEICGNELKDCDPAFATTTGRIMESVDGFCADEDEWVNVVCTDCSHKIGEFISNLCMKYDEKQDHVDCVLHCNKCGCNIFDKGISEVSVGGFTDTEITFNNHKVQIHPSLISDPKEIEAFCTGCGDRLYDGDVRADEIVDFYEGHVEYLESYLTHQGGAPVHGW